MVNYGLNGSGLRDFNYTFQPWQIRSAGKGILLERVAFHNVIITSILINLDIFTDGIKVKEGVRFF